MEQRLTCANHSDEVVLEQIGWSTFICPRCGSDYSIGRKVVVLDAAIYTNNASKKIIRSKNK